MRSTSNFQPSIFSQISHELRIPLTGILANLHFLEETRLSNKQKKFLESISEAARELLGAEVRIYEILKNQK